MPTFSRERRWAVLFVLCIAVLLVVVDNTIVNVALPMLSRDLHASNSPSSGSSTLTRCPSPGCFSPGGAVGSLGSKARHAVGTRRLWRLLLMAAISHNVGDAVVARALMGASAAFIFPATLSTLTVVFEDLDERAKAFGIWGATSGIAIALGPIAGGALHAPLLVRVDLPGQRPLVLVAIVAIGDRRARVEIPSVVDWTSAVSSSGRWG